MTEKERLLLKLEKVRALAERGVGGEKESAERLLASLMDRYNITEEDLEADKVETHWIRWKTDWERRLLHQLAYMHLGSGHAFGCVGKYTGRSRNMVGIDCTAAVYIEIEADFDFYRKALAEDMEIFYSAFIQKNNLFPPPELAATNGSADPDMERLVKMEAMMGGIDRRTRHKALGPAEKTEGPL